MSSSAIKSYPVSYYPYCKGKKVWRTTDLTEAVRAYQLQRKGKKDLLQKIYYFVYSYPVDKRMLAEEDASEFLIYFMPTIDYILKKFSFQGYPVEQYLIRCIRFRLKDFKRNNKSKTYQQMIIEGNSINRIYQETEYNEICGEDPPAYSTISPSTKKSYFVFDASNADSSLDSHYRIEADKLLYLVLLHALILPKKIIPLLDEVFHAQLNFERPVSDMITDIRIKNTKRLKQLEKLELQRNELYTPIIKIEIEISNEQQVRQLRKLEEKLQSKKTVYNNVLQRIARFNMFTYHRQIAEVLKIPKGSVDSGLFYLREKQRSLLDAFA